MDFRNAVTPPLLTSRETTQTWAARRAELEQIIVPHEYGGLPPLPQKTTGVLACDASAYPNREVRYRTYEVRCDFVEAAISFSLHLWIPPGDGPFPVVLDGDGCWRYFNDTTINMVVARGYAAASFERTATAADSKTESRTTGLYRLFPDAEFGALSAWAWGYHRCVDVLLDVQEIDAKKIAITGHSRGGKTALLAGATDPRIAVTNPNCSGCGGSGLNRLKADGAELIDDFNKSGNMFWFGPGYGEYAGKDKEIPYDQHFLHAMVAPRGLLVTEAYGDPWANPPGSYAACKAAKEVYDLLGASSAIGWAVREGIHAHAPVDYETLLDFLDCTFMGQQVPRSFQREYFPDVESILS